MSNKLIWQLGKKYLSVTKHLTTGTERTYILNVKHWEINALSDELFKLARLQGQNKIFMHLIDPFRGELLLAGQNLNLPKTLQNIGWKVIEIRSTLAGKQSHVQRRQKIEYGICFCFIYDISYTSIYLTIHFNSANIYWEATGLDTMSC